MWHHRYQQWITAGCLALALLPAMSFAAGASSLSRWLERDTLPELREFLSNHPRFAGQRLQLHSGQGDALSETIATLLGGHLDKLQGVSLLVSRPESPGQSYPPASIDELNCQGESEADYILRVIVVQAGAGKGRVQLSLVEAVEPLQQLRSWQWAGTFTADERRHAEMHATANGSLVAPWAEGDVAAAAQSLSSEMACALRPQVATRISLQWPASVELSALFVDTVNASRHMLGSYPELATTGDRADYTITSRVERFRGDIWQLWLIGSPHDSGLAPVQAVTYFRAEGLEPSIVATVAGPGKTPAPVAAPVAPPDLGKALDFIDVEVLDAIQADRNRSRADLLVTLRIGNRANWPINYSFTLSGGHFDRCIATVANYRHDRYGSVEGRLAPGASVVQRLRIEKAQHRPTPLFGTRKCAGFRDLDGLEQFATRGYKVTDYVRWDL